MNHTNLAWTILAWLMAAAAAGFGSAWLIQQWRMAEGRAAGATLQRELDRLRRQSARMADPGTPQDTRWTLQAERLAHAERTLAVEREQRRIEADGAAALLLQAEHERRDNAAAHTRALAEQQAALAQLREEGLRAAAQAATEATARATAAFAAERAILQAEHARALDALDGLRQHELDSLRTAHAREHDQAEARLADAVASREAAQRDALAAAEARHVKAVSKLESTQLQAQTAAKARHKEALAKAETSHQAALAALAASHREAQAAAIAELQTAHELALRARPGTVYAPSLEDQEALQRAAQDRERIAAQERELMLVRSRLGTSSERILELEQALNRVQMMELGRKRDQGEAQAKHLAELAALRSQLAAQAQAATATLAAERGSAEPGAGGAEPAAAPGPDDQRRVLELESALQRARRQAGEQRAEVAGLKGRVRDLESRLAQLWTEGGAGASPP
ncbi:MAG: hypothetical protein KGI67_03455 [Pseudomonadota bacterium]|nr:hypothetical protein [Pseudomonadota bacterium]